MASYTQSGSIRQQSSSYSDEITLKQVDNALMRWIKRHEAGKCPRCGCGIPKNSGLHCGQCFDDWQEEWGNHLV